MHKYATESSQKNTLVDVPEHGYILEEKGADIRSPYESEILTPLNMTDRISLENTKSSHGLNKVFRPNKVVLQRIDDLKKQRAEKSVPKVLNESPSKNIEKNFSKLVKKTRNKTVKNKKIKAAKKKLKKK